MTLNQRLLRGLLILAALFLCVWLIAVHGLRGVVIVAAVVILISVVQTPAFQAVGRTLVRLTGSRRRALAWVMGVILAAMVVVSVVEAVH